MSPAAWWAYWWGVVTIVSGAIAAAASFLWFYWDQRKDDVERAAAQTLELRLSESRERVAAAEQRLAEQNERTVAIGLKVAEQQERAALAEERAAKAEASLAELQAARRPRAIDSHRLSLQLRGSMSAGVSLIRYVDDGSNEPAALANEIAGTLRGLGYFGAGVPSRWTAPIEYGGPSMSYTPIGIEIIAGAERRADGTALQKAFAAGGMETSVKAPMALDTNYPWTEARGPHFPPNALMIVVGIKPR